MDADRHSLPHPGHICESVLGFLRDRMLDLHKWTSAMPRRSPQNERQLRSSEMFGKQSNSRDHQHSRSFSGVSSSDGVAFGVSNSTAYWRRKAASTTREDLGHATWVLLHTLAAQYPEKPTKSQRADVAALVGSTTAGNLSMLAVA
jgi:hypothetical protein